MAIAILLEGTVLLKGAVELLAAGMLGQYWLGWLVEYSGVEGRTTLRSFGYQFLLQSVDVSLHIEYCLFEFPFLACLILPLCYRFQHFLIVVDVPN
jgi:hypothetical protein